MAIPLPSLSGTEVLRRGCVNAQSSTHTSLKFDGTVPTTTGQSGNTVPALHIITILNITFCEQGNANQLLHMKKLVSIALFTKSYIQYRNNMKCWNSISRLSCCCRNSSIEL